MCSSDLARELVAFCDGELTPYRARLFRAHLGICEICRRNVVDVMQLIAQLTDSQRSNDAGLID